MSLRDSITSLASGTYTITRTASGTYDATGAYTQGGLSSFDIVASIQPATGRQLRDLPEGQRGDEVVAVFTITELRTRTPTTEPDTVAYRGEPWTLITVKRWDSFGATHYECMACRGPSPRGTIP